MKSLDRIYWEARIALVDGEISNFMKQKKAEWDKKDAKNELVAQRANERVKERLEKKQRRLREERERHLRLPEVSDKLQKAGEFIQCDTVGSATLREVRKKVGGIRC